MEGESSLCLPVQLPVDHEKASTSHSGADANVPTIFLSHSGQQKDFVEHLFNALRHANHTPFLDKHSLPKGSPFPDYIREAALGCRLGVVILSEDFLTSKWPMLELEMLVLCRGPNAKVFPVCYKLSFEDLKSSSNISRWRSKWMEMEGGKHVEQWEKAVEALARFNGEIRLPTTSEITFIEKVVHQICKLVPCPTPYDMSLIQGHQRLAEEIASMFDRVKATCNEESTCVVGLYGVGGLGKTTLCGSMVNYYASEYQGRSYLIEFPTDGAESKIVEECKGALRKLANLGNELLDGVKKFDQVIRLMTDHMKNYDVFLAIDNVWNSCSEEAGRLLQVGFSATSKILLTSRSEKVLKDLHMQHTYSNKYCIVPLPTPEKEEAFQILQATFDRGHNLCSLWDVRKQIGILLERCRFDGSYNPLALKALANHMRKVCPPEELQNSKDHLSGVLEEISQAPLPTLMDVIRLSYDHLPEINKHMFLDIAIFFHDESYYQCVTLYDNRYHCIHRWMCLCYKELITETQVTALICDLASDGLIQNIIDTGRSYPETRVRVHDLYMELAYKEATSSSRFFASGPISSVREEIEWERLERVLILKNEEMCFFEKIGKRECKKLHILHVEGVSIRSWSEMRLDSMPCLRVLSLGEVNCVTEEQKTRKRMGWAQYNAPGRVIKLNALVQLLSLWVVHCNCVERITGLDALPNLKDLTLKWCRSLKELEGLRGLIRLEHLQVEWCHRLGKLEGLRSLIRLEHLQVEWCKSLKTILNGLTPVKRPCRQPWSCGSKEEERGSLSPSLQFLAVQYCEALEKMPDVGGLTCLETLILQFNDALDVKVGGEYLTSTLKRLEIRGCKRVRRFPSLKECVHLESLEADHGVIKDSLLLHKLPNLRMLRIRKSDWSSDVFNEQWKHATLLQHLHIFYCGSIEKLEKVGCLMSSLKVLWVEECKALEEIEDLSALHCLEELDIRWCRRLKKVGGLRGISAHLQRLNLDYCISLEESSLPDTSLLKSIKDVHIRGCRK